jgi:hypothetical protein
MTVATRLARLVRRLAGPPTEAHRAPMPQREPCRLYELRGARVEAHLEPQRDGRLAVVALAIEGTTGTSWYWVSEPDPWSDFERQAGFEDARWGPCRAPSAGM